MRYSIEQAAKVCHESTRALCQTLGDDSLVAWEDAPEWQRQSSVSAVRFCLENPGATAQQIHDAWVEEKKADGWAYGPAKDAHKKTHPCLVAFDRLPVEQQAKDELIGSVVAAVRKLIDQR